MRSAVFTGALVCAVMACSRSSAQQAKRPAQADVVATVGSTPITLAEVDDKAMQMPVANFAYNAGGWRVERHPRFVAGSGSVGI